jgi:vacuolar-type H+-ATPase subunit I/STV1
MSKEERAERLRKRLVDSLRWEIEQLSQQIKELQKTKNAKAELLYEVEKVLEELAQ